MAEPSVFVDNSVCSKDVKQDIDENSYLDECCFEKSDESKYGVELLKNAFNEKNLQLADEIIEDMISKSSIKGLTKLHLASGYGICELLEKYLIQDKMNPNSECSFNELKSITPIHFSVGIGPDSITNEREKTIEILVRNGANVNHLTSRNDTALHWATKLADLKTCETLIKCGCDLSLLNSDSCTCAHGAAFFKNIPILELLANNKIDVAAKDFSGKNILHLLCKDFTDDDSDYEANYLNTNEEHLKAKKTTFINFVKRLLEEFKLDPNEKDLSDFSPLMYACEFENLDLIQTLIDHKGDINHMNSEGLTCMLIAIINSCPKVVRLLLKNGFDLKVRQPNCSYLTDAAYFNNIDVINDLLEAGCDLNETKEEENGVILNPLWAACERSHLEVVELLLQKGADPVTRPDLNMTALHCAAMAQYENLQIVKLLVEHKCPINLKSTQAGETPLFLACNSGYCEIVEYLINLGVDPNTSSPSSKTCFQQSLFRGHKDIILLLINKGYLLTEDDKKDLNLFLIDLYEDGDVDTINFLLGKNLITKQQILDCISEINVYKSRQKMSENQAQQESSDQLEDNSLVATLSDLKLELIQSCPKTIEELDIFLSSKTNITLDCNSSDDNYESK